MRVIFFGTPQFAALHLEALLNTPGVDVALVVTNPDRPAGRGNRLTASPVKELAVRYNIPCLQPQSIRKDIDGFISAADKHGPFDVGVVVAFGQILPQRVLDLPKAGCVNVHASLLPRWRGAAPIQRAIMHGDTETGVCIMKMEAGLDTGPVYSVRATPVLDSDTTDSLHERLAHIGTQLLREILPDIVAGTAQAIAQSTDGITYAQKITNSEAKISWNESAATLVRLIHGLSPAPGAYTTFNGQRLKIFRVRALVGASEAPGTVLMAAGNDLRVATGDGILAIEELQLEGKKRLKTAEFVASRLLTPGATLS